MSEKQSEPAWFPRRDRNDKAIQLICLPHAGGGSAIFHRFKSELPAEIELWPARLPGREGRFGEEPIRSLERLLDEMFGEFQSIVSEPYALMGHSMGAYIAFELARLVRRRDLPMPAFLFVVAARAPQLGPAKPLLHGLPDDELIVELQRRYGDIPAGRDERLIRSLLPTIRADLTMLEEYQYHEDAPLECPIIAIAGSNDASVRFTDMAGWREQTSTRFSQRTIAGGHFLFSESGAQVMQLIGQKLLSAAPDAPTEH